MALWASEQNVGYCCYDYFSTCGAKNGDKTQELVVWVYTTITIESGNLYLLNICQHINLDMLIAIVSKMSS